MTDLLIRRSAIISDDGLYRYELRREWDARRPLVVGMLNPSTADGEVDDPTITRLMARAQRLDCGSLIVWNLGAGRATDPVDWLRMDDPIGPENDVHIRRILAECRDRDGIAVAGWGALGGHRSRDRIVSRMAAEIGVSFHCWGDTKFGHPRHPLYVGYSRPLVPWLPADTGDGQ